jgi:hypothetical protein
MSFNHETIITLPRGAPVPVMRLGLALATPASAEGAVDLMQVMGRKRNGFLKEKGGVCLTSSDRLHAWH